MLMLMAACGIGLLGCRDFAEAVDLGFVNETDRPLFIAFRSPSGEVVSARAAPMTGGLALQYPTFADWRGGKVDILTVDCRVVASFDLTERAVAYVARDSLTIDVIPMSEAEDEVRKTILDSDITCPMAESEAPRD
jgi:hypothetical protein